MLLGQSVEIGQTSQVARAHRNSNRCSHAGYLGQDGGGDGRNGGIVDSQEPMLFTNLGPLSLNHA